MKVPLLGKRFLAAGYIHANVNSRLFRKNLAVLLYFLSDDNLVTLRILYFSPQETVNVISKIYCLIYHPII